MSSKTYDLIVIGAGPGGYVAAIRAAQLGLSVACVEKRESLGGTCLNIGCIPSKALLDSSEHFYFAKNSLQKHGIETGELQLNLTQMLKRKDSIVRQLTTGIQGLFKKNKIDSIQGLAKLAEVKGNSKAISVESSEGNKTSYQAQKVILATGSSPTELPFLPFDGEQILSSTEALSLKEIPKKLAVVGGGYIGLELGSVWQRLGSEVTVVEFADRILPGMDADMADELYKSLKKQGMKFHLSSKVTGAKTSNKTVALQFESLESGEAQSLDCDKVLVAVGRKPYSESLGLADVGIKCNDSGQVEVDQDFQTNIAGVYAIGDLIRGPMLAHKAEDEGVAVAEILAGQAGHVNYECIPGVIFTHPELAYVGLNEDQIKSEDIQYKVGRFPFMANGRAKAMGESEGSVKILSEAQNDRVLGVHIVGPRASEMIAEAVAVMEFGGSAEDIARTCHAHPTLSESVKEAALAVDKRSLHF